MPYIIFTKNLFEYKTIIYTNNIRTIFLILLKTFGIVWYNKNNRCDGDTNQPGEMLKPFPGI